MLGGLWELPTTEVNKKNSEPIKFWGCNKKLKLCLQNNE